MEFNDRKRIQDLESKYAKAVEKRSSMPRIGSAVEDKLDYIESLHPSTRKTKLKIGKHTLNDDFIRAINQLTYCSRLNYYIRNYNLFEMILLNKQYNPPAYYSDVDYHQLVVIEAYKKSNRLKIWKKCKLCLDRIRSLLYAEQSKQIILYNMGDYILRKSRNSDYYSLVLQSISLETNNFSKTVRIGFNNYQKYIEWWKYISEAIKFKEWEGIMKSTNQPPQSYIKEKFCQCLRAAKDSKAKKDFNQATVSKNKENEDFYSILSQNQLISDSQLNEENEKINQNVRTKQKEEKKSIVGALLQSDNEEQVKQLVEMSSEEKAQKAEVDIFHQLFPDEDIDDIEAMEDYQFQKEFKTMKVYVQNGVRNKIKIAMPIGKKSIANSNNWVAALTHPKFIKQWNSNVAEISIKQSIVSQNSLLMHMQLNPYNKLYRRRDYIFIRHIFKKGNKIFLVDKSIQNSSYPPFTSMVRGSLQSKHCIISDEDNCLLLCSFEFRDSSALSEIQIKNISLNYVNNFAYLPEFVANYSNNLTLTANIFDLPQSFFQVKQKKQQNKSKITLKLIKEEPSSPKLTTQQIDAVMQQGELQNAEPSEKGIIKIQKQFNSDGSVIISNAYLLKKNRLQPIEQQKIVLKELKKTEQENHPIWKKEWTRNEKGGGLLFIDEQKINQQKRVLKFVLGKMCKNIFAAKSVLNISLPVDIFSCESNLQRFLHSLTYAPKLLEPLVCLQPLKRLLGTIAFGISISSMYLNMEKPFNPILGETFQCWINGCPGYAEQISHHPPIASIYLVGRGYIISGQFQSKVNMSINSGTGSNQGTYIIDFKDRCRICFNTPPGQISGLTYGERKFNIVAYSAYYWIEQENLMAQIEFNPTKKGFFAKKETPIDYFEGTVQQVTPKFTKAFVSGERRAPKDIQIIKKHGTLHGIWNQYIKFEEQTLLNINQNYPLQLEYENCPLPSDSNWREDIVYRFIQQISTAQNWKEKLQELQRTDKKIRQRLLKK